MHIQYAAHCDHPVSHSTIVATISLALGGAAIAAAVVIFSGGTALVALGAVGTWGSVGLNVGKTVDSFLPESTRGEVVSGVSTVFLGPELKPAARADEDTQVNCCGDEVGEGSRSVVIGPDLKPMSRKGDRTKCGGTLADGIHSILVGGNPSAEGQQFSEKDALAVTILSAILDIIGGVATRAKAGAINLWRGRAQLAAVVVGFVNEDAGKMLKAIATGRPQDAGEIIDGMYTGAGALGSAVRIISPPATPSATPPATPATPPATTGRLTS